MIIELINTGSELMLGSVLNTHQQWICQQFGGLGCPVDRQVAIPDSGEAIQQAVREALTRADVVVVTGGLGPTSDDLTRELIASMLKLDLREDPSIVAHIESFFSARKRPMPPNTRVQAQVPGGATVLPNPFGTAPGLILEVEPGRFRDSESPSLLIMLPGPPRELRPMFLNSVVPMLREKLSDLGPFQCKILRTTGIGESLMEQRIAPLLAPLIIRGLQLGYCARLGAVDVRLMSRGADGEALITEAESIVRSAIGKSIFGCGSEELESVVIRLLTELGRTVAVAESCTGGLISHRLTNIPGASAVFAAGLVTYSNEAKQMFLGVRAETLSNHGAVSEETVREMADGARARNKTTYGLAVTGIAGPAGGTAAKPIGTAFIGLAGPNSTNVLRQLNPYERESFKQATAQQALEMLRRDLIE
ncbi:MAG: competence/damage-inducible protein A [Verrucomicrobia bacterium]|nr:competence/damage-inducible protein A [Verrucomicrobiota bacterium]